MVVRKIFKARPGHEVVLNYVCESGDSAETGWVHVVFHADDYVV